MFMATLFSVFVSSKKPMKGHEIELMAIIQLHEAQFFTQNMYGKRSVSMSRDRIEANQVAILV